LSSGKLWFDMNDGFLHGKDIADDDFSVLVDEIMTKISTEKIGDMTVS